MKWIKILKKGIDNALCVCYNEKANRHFGAKIILTIMLAKGEPLLRLSSSNAVNINCKNSLVLLCLLGTLCVLAKFEIL